MIIASIMIWMFYAVVFHFEKVLFGFIGTYIAYDIFVLLLSALTSFLMFAKTFCSDLSHVDIDEFMNE